MIFSGNDNLLINYYESTKKTLEGGFSSFMPDTVDQTYRLERWESLKGYFSNYETEMISRGLLKQEQLGNKKVVEHSLKGQNDHWDKLLNNIEETMRIEKAENQRDSHKMFGVNDHWNALIESVAMSDNQVTKVSATTQEPGKEQEFAKIQGLIGESVQQAEEIMNLTAVDLKQYSGKTLSPKDIESITQQFQTNMLKIVGRYTGERSKGISWSDRLDNLKNRLNSAVKEVKYKTIDRLQSIKKIPKVSKKYARSKLLQVVVSTNKKLQQSLGRIEEKLADSVIDKASEPTKLTEADQVTLEEVFKDFKGDIVVDKPMSRVDNQENSEGVSAARMKQSATINDPKDKLANIIAPLTKEEKALFLQINEQRKEQLANSYFRSASNQSTKQKDKLETMEKSFSSEQVQKVVNLYDKNINYTTGKSHGNIIGSEDVPKIIKAIEKEEKKEKSFKADRSFSIKGIKKINGHISSQEKKPAKSKEQTI